MQGNRFFLSFRVTVAVLASFILMLVSFGVPSAQAQANGQLTGFIYGSDLKNPVENAIVELRNIQSGAVFSSTPTSSSGLYKITNIPPGQYVIGVKVANDGYNCEYVISIMAGETGKLSLALRPGKTAEIKQPVYPTPAGLAEKIGGRKPFFLTPAGIAVIVVAAGGAGYGIYHLAKGEEEETSPAKK